MLIQHCASYSMTPPSKNRSPWLTREFNIAATRLLLTLKELKVVHVEIFIPADQILENYWFEIPRLERRIRAAAVQAKSAHLSPLERLARLDAAGLVAAKERAKLAKKLEQLKNKPAPTAETTEPKKEKFKKGVSHRKPVESKK